MNNRAFRVLAKWDADAKVYYAESNIIGLAIEADTLEEFEVILFDVAPELILSNHISAKDIAEKPLKELIPGILWQKPDELACA